MKNLLATVLLSLLSTTTFASRKIVKEVWSCQGQSSFNATFTENSSVVDLDYVDAEFRFQQPAQLSGLNGKSKTVLVGFQDGWDQVDYKVTLIRTNPEDFSNSGRDLERVEATALVESDGHYDCLGHRLDSYTLRCQVEISRE